MDEAKVGKKPTTKEKSWWRRMSLVSYVRGLRLSKEPGRRTGTTQRKWRWGRKDQRRQQRSREVSSRRKHRAMTKGMQRTRRKRGQNHRTGKKG